MTRRARGANANATILCVHRHMTSNASSPHVAAEKKKFLARVFVSIFSVSSVFPLTRPRPVASAYPTRAEARRRSARSSTSAFVAFVGDGDGDGDDDDGSDDGSASAFLSFLRWCRSSGLESDDHPGAFSFSMARPGVRARIFSPRVSTVVSAPVTRNTDRTAWFSSAIFAAADCASSSAVSARTRRTAAAAAAAAAAACASTEAPRSRNNAAALRVMGLPRRTAASAGAARDWARVLAANADACVVLRRRSSCARVESW